MMGAGQGMATHGVGEGGVAGMGAQMAIGMGIGGAMAAPYAQPQFPIAGAPGVAPGVAVVPGAGAGPASGKKRFCTACGGEVFPAAKFCANCGTPQAAPGG
jgi:membrane protease subunit (stomatin/prohibitin family)